MEDAKSDLLNVISSLEAHWHVLEAEISEINLDIDNLEGCIRKYGELYFREPLCYLKELKRSKKAKMKEIIKNMEGFNNNLQGGRRLVKQLSRGQPFVAQEFPTTVVVPQGAHSPAQPQAAAGYPMQGTPQQGRPSPAGMPQRGN